MARFGGKKDPYADLPVEYKDSLAAMSDDEIKNKVYEATMAQHENMEAKRKDVDLAEKKAAAKFAGEQYAEATKMNRLRIAYAHMILEGRGKV